MKSDTKLIGVGILTAIASSICCITPVLAIIAGTSGIASTFSWLEPFSPYFTSLTVLILGFAWYQKFSPRKQINCNCETDPKLRFVQSKAFLGIVTGFAILILFFPYHSYIFYPKGNNQVIIVNKSNIQTVEFRISGMTCNSCAEHVNHEVNKLNGIINSSVYYQQGIGIIEFDNSKATLKEIEEAINSTGYSVTDKTIK